MAALEALDALLAAASRACCSPLAIFIQIQGCVICLTLALGWACAAYIRNKVIRRMKLNIVNGNSFAFICEDVNDLEHSAQVNLPRVSVIMPLKGFGEHNLQNWRSQITSLYGGPLEFLFIVESTDDPAYRAVSLLISDFQDNIDAKVIVAGLSTTCSQKIHNQLVGVERMHKESKYVLFLDDDVRLHPGSIGALTSEMEKNPEIFIQTGYPLDLPSGNLGSYCIYEYHMNTNTITQGTHLSSVSSWSFLKRKNFPQNLIEFVILTYRHIARVMLVRHELKFKKNFFKQFIHYLSEKCIFHSLTCFTNYHLVLEFHEICVMRLSRMISVTQIFSCPCSMGFATGGRTVFLWGGCMMMHAEDFRKDLYGVVSGLQDGGYSDDMTLAAIAGQHKRLIWSPPVAVFPHPLARDLSFSRYWNYLRKQTFVLESYISRVNWLMNRALFSSHCYLSWGFVWPYFMALIHLAAALRAPYSGSRSEASASSCGLLLVSCLLVSTIIELLSMWNLTKVEIQLCNMLSPEGPTVSLGSYDWRLVFLAMLVDNFLYPISAIRSHFSQSINWSGVRYHLKNGKISKIERSMGNGPTYSDLAWKHLYGKKQFTPKSSFLSSLSRSIVHWRQPKKYDI
ncbi:unnamed protein product [Musa acuminata var. zebrina]